VIKIREVKVQYIHREKSDKCISIQFPEKKYYVNQWVTIDEATRLAEELHRVIVEGLANE